MVLYLASTSAGKLREFREGARARKVSVEPLPAMQKLRPCVEDRKTFEEQARKKAAYYSEHGNGLVFADDSGLCIDALGGAPGVFSARFAGQGANDVANNQKLITDLRRAEIQSPAQRPTRTVPTIWTAHYVCVIALAETGRILTVVEGRADGAIIDTPRGAGGFGYDPLFYYPPLQKTFAELSPDEKFAVSHRGAAFRRLLEYLNLPISSP